MTKQAERTAQELKRRLEGRKRINLTMKADNSRIQIRRWSPKTSNEVFYDIDYGTCYRTYRTLEEIAEALIYYSRPETFNNAADRALRG